MSKRPTQAIIDAAKRVEQAHERAQQIMQRKSSAQALLDLEMAYQEASDATWALRRFIEIEAFNPYSPKP